MPESVKSETSMVPTTEPLKPPNVEPGKEKAERYVRIDYGETGRAHEIQVVGISKPSELRNLLEFGLRHIRACVFRGKPINSPAQVSSHKRENGEQ